MIGPRSNQVLTDFYSGSLPYTITPLAAIRSKVGSAVTVNHANDNTNGAAVNIASTADVAIVIVGNHPHGLPAGPSATRPPATSTPIGPSPTRTSTPAATATSGPATGLKVQYKAGDTSAADNQIKPHMQVVNGGSATVALTELKARYYYSKEGTATEQYWCD